MMRFTSVRFSTSVVVFKGDYATGMLATFDNETSLKCDSLETDATGVFLLCSRTYPDGSKQVKAVPVSKIESADPIPEPAAPVRKAG